MWHVFSSILIVANIKLIDKCPLRIYLSIRNALSRQANLNEFTNLLLAYSVYVIVNMSKVSNLFYFRIIMDSQILFRIYLPATLRVARRAGSFEFRTYMSRGREFKREPAPPSREDDEILADKGCSN